jgi:hypothetical protein
MDDSHTIKLNQEGQINVNGIIVDALYAPMFQISLLCVSQLDRQGYSSVFKTSTCIIAKNSMTDITADIVSNNSYTFMPEETASSFITICSGNTFEISTSPHSPSPQTETPKVYLMSLTRKLFTLMPNTKHLLSLRINDSDMLSL